MTRTPGKLMLAVRLRRTALTAAALGLVGVLLYAGGVPCLFARLFHTPCPGCGSTRACLAVLSGDVHGVFAYNPLGPVAALLIGILAAQSLVSMLVHGDFRDAGSGRLGFVVTRLIFFVAGAEFVLWIARFFGALGGPVPV